MRQANSSIRGYIYQFNKSIYEIIASSDNDTIVLEGIIEDIDIYSLNNSTSIQCKYHEDKTFQISSVAEPILELICNFAENNAIGKSMKYILYAYYSNNVDKIEIDDFRKFIFSTVNKEIILKYFHRIFTITNTEILTLVNKSKKSQEEKKNVIDYYNSNKEMLEWSINLEEFWESFKYEPAEQFDKLVQEIIVLFSNIVDKNIAENLYYPNSFTLISHLSSEKDLAKRKITKKELLAYLEKTKSIIINSWTLSILKPDKVLKNKKEYLSSYFANNSDIRTFVFSDKFLNKNKEKIIPFILAYTEKYFKKKKLQKQPIFIFGNNSEEIMNKTILALYKYQKHVNTGIVAGIFNEESFINNMDCSSDYVCKIGMEKNISKNILISCNINQLYIIGNIDNDFKSDIYFCENIDIENIEVLSYLTGLNKTLEVK